MHEKLLQELAVKIEQVKSTKVENSLFEEFRAHVDETFKDLASNYQIQIDRMLNMENYVEKYIPIYINR